MEHWSNFFPYVFLAFKVLVVVVCGYFAIKWHFDQEKKINEAKESEAKKTEDTDIY